MATNSSLTMTTSRWTLARILIKIYSLLTREVCRFMQKVKALGGPVSILSFATLTIPWKSVSLESPDQRRNCH